HNQRRTMKQAFHRSSRATILGKKDRAVTRHKRAEIPNFPRRGKSGAIINGGWKARQYYENISGALVSKGRIGDSESNSERSVISNQGTVRDSCSDSLQPRCEFPCSQLRFGRGGAEGEAQQDRGEKCRDHDQNDDRREEAVVHDANAAADAGKDQADFAAGHHAETDRPAVHALWAAPAARDFAEDGHNGERKAGNENVAAAEGFEFHLNSHPHKKERNDQRLEGRQEFLERLTFELLVEEFVEDHSGGESADNRSEARDIGKPGEQKGEAQTEEQLQIADAHRAKAAEDARRDPNSDEERTDQEERGDESRFGDARRADGAGERESADDGEHDQAEHIVNHCCAENDARFFASFLAEIAKDAGGDAHARSGEDAADKEIAGKGGSGIE